MKAFRFEGYSDDTFGEVEQTSDEYDNCASGKPIQYELKTPDGAGVIVTGLYGNPINKGAGWMIGVETIDEGKPIDWPITMHPSHEGYWNQLAVLAPDDAELRCLNREENNE